MRETMTVYFGSYDGHNWEEMDQPGASHFPYFRMEVRPLSVIDWKGRAETAERAIEELRRKYNDKLQHCEGLVSRMTAASAALQGW